MQLVLVVVLSGGCGEMTQQQLNGGGVGPARCQTLYLQCGWTASCGEHELLSFGVNVLTCSHRHRIDKYLDILLAMKSEATAIFAPQDGRWKITVSFDGRRFCVPKFRH